MENTNNFNDNNSAKLVKNNLRPRGYENVSQRIDLSSTKLHKFPLFDKRDDNFIYEKKFFNELPKDLVFPKAFSLTPKIENFAKFDMMTMLFGLKKSQDLLTNPRLNTNIHQDFINNSIQLIFQDKKIDFKNKTFSENSTDEEKLIEQKKTRKNQERYIINY